MIRNRRVVRVVEMSEECAVSERTIYRDIASLARMQFPIYYNNGYRLARDPGLAIADLQTEEFDLICYCLRNNPLAVHQYFLNRMKTIEQKILCRRGRSCRSGIPPLLKFSKDRKVADERSESLVLTPFAQAIVDRRLVDIVMKTGQRRTGLVPKLIHVGRDRIELVVEQKPGARSISIPLDHVDKASMSATASSRRSVRIVRKKENR